MISNLAKLSDCIEFRKLTPPMQPALEEFFAAIEHAGYTQYFHPHPFNREEAEKYANYEGRDLYLVVIESGKILGYGMLRGWDAGFEIPSLGIALHPALTGTGLGESFMYFLHAVARYRGAKRIRLKVYQKNYSAVKLYQKLGYVFEDLGEEELLGFITL
ncbi:MAG: GNAT family N-acetyltransferase [Desulfobaccales bacterium]